MINNRNISESNPKHYYAESERIASKIGGGKLYDLHSIAHDEQVAKKISYNAKLLYHVMECTGSKAKIEDLNLLKILTHLHDSLAPEKHLFFYHPDHLGSSSWITYSDGSSIQHLHYLPFGESFVDQRISSFGSRYTFSAKEKDVETGYGYFGARYYSSDLSIWISVDPMSDKYPSLSPYVYCANNPIKLVDPNGMEWIVNEDGYIQVGKNSDDHNVYFVTGNKNNFGDKKKDKDGNLISVDIGKDMDKGISYNEGQYIDDKTNKLTDYSAQSFSISDKKIAQKLFRYASKYTDVEWSFWGDDKKMQLSNSHLKCTDIYGGNKALYSAQQGSLDFFFHSHPRNECTGMFSSSKDRNTSSKCLESSPNAVIGIMHQGYLYNLKGGRINWDGSTK